MICPCERQLSCFYCLGVSKIGLIRDVYYDEVEIFLLHLDCLLDVCAILYPEAYGERVGELVYFEGHVGQEVKNNEYYLPISVNMKI